MKRLIEVDTMTGNERDITYLAEINGNTLEQEIMLRASMISSRYTYQIEEGVERSDQ